MAYFYKNVEIQVDNDDHSKEHIDEDFAALEKVGIDNILKERFIPWFITDDFSDRDHEKVWNGLRVYEIIYNCQKFAAQYSPTGKEGLFGQFEFDFVSTDDYTADMLEATAFEVYVQDGEIVGTDGYEI